MALNLEIRMAEPSDVRAVGEVMLRAMEPNMIDRFMVPEEDFVEQFESKMRWFVGDYEKSIKDPTRRIFKAVVKDTDEVVGLGAIQFSDGDFDADGPDGQSLDDPLTNPPAFPPTVAALPAEKKGGFAQFYFVKSRSHYVKHMSGFKHVVWTTLHVKPSYQGKGVGSTMLKWGFKEYGLEREWVWLNTHMRGRNIYRRFGWEDKDYFDLDLSDWGGKLRGFGIHRTWFMLRRPGKYQKLEGFVDE